MLLDNILKILKNKSKDKAYTIEDSSFTYEELYRFISNIYQFLLENNYDKKPVIVYGHKELYMKATFLACSFAGMTYVPIDISMPKQRVNEIIKQVKPGLIIGDIEKGTYKNVSKNEIFRVMNNLQYKEIEKIYLKPEDIYYIIFTSGSTGTPKGVKATYENVDSCIRWLKEITKIENGVILNQAVFSFDLSVADLYLSIINGSEHYIIENNIDMDFQKLYKELNKSNATLAVMTPSFADLLLVDKSFNRELMPDLNTILFCGEKLTVKTVEKLYARFKDINIINSYGPTECTFAVTSIEISKDLIQKEELPVGKPKDDVEIFILDEKMNELQEGNIGEILITGKSVADGYINKEENKSFFTYNNKAAYLTGDLGYLQDGILYYNCRKDKQIKYKGYRIELQDIESNLNRLDYIDKAIVVAKSNNDKITKLIAFVKLKDNISKTSLDIREDLLEKVPEYMCPGIKVIDKIPLNRNGKCDEKKLLEEY